MKRVRNTKAVVEEEKPEVNLLGEKLVKWRKIGKGFFRMSNRIIKENQIFEAYPSEIPKAFRDSIIPLEKQSNNKVPNPVAPVPVLKTKYSPKHVSGGWYDIVDDNGKVINEKKMRKEEAQELIKELQ
jgi:hypothetical protein